MRVRVLPTRLFHRLNAIHEADAWVIVALVALHLAASAAAHFTFGSPVTLSPALMRRLANQPLFVSMA